jgi:hypothetical protein
MNQKYESHANLLRLRTMLRPLSSSKKIKTQTSVTPILVFEIWVKMKI